MAPGPWGQRPAAMDRTHARATTKEDALATHAHGRAEGRNSGKSLIRDELAGAGGVDELKRRILLWMDAADADPSAPHALTPPGEAVPPRLAHGSSPTPRRGSLRAVREEMKSYTGSPSNGLSRAGFAESPFSRRRASPNAGRSDLAGRSVSAGRMGHGPPGPSPPVRERETDPAAMTREGLFGVNEAAVLRTQRSGRVGSPSSPTCSPRWASRAKAQHASAADLGQAWKGADDLGALQADPEADALVTRVVQGAGVAAGAAVRGSSLDVPGAARPGEGHGGDREREKDRLPAPLRPLGSMRKSGVISSVRESYHNSPSPADAFEGLHAVFAAGAEGPEGAPGPRGAGKDAAGVARDVAVVADGALAPNGRGSAQGAAAWAGVGGGRDDFGSKVFRDQGYSRIHRSASRSKPQQVASPRGAWHVHAAGGGNAGPRPVAVAEAQRSRSVGPPLRASPTRASSTTQRRLRPAKPEALDLPRARVSLLQVAEATDLALLGADAGQATQGRAKGVGRAKASREPDRGKGQVAMGPKAGSAAKGGAGGSNTGGGVGAATAGLVGDVAAPENWPAIPGLETEMPSVAGTKGDGAPGAVDATVDATHAAATVEGPAEEADPANEAIEDLPASLSVMLEAALHECHETTFELEGLLMSALRDEGTGAGADETLGRLTQCREVLGRGQELLAGALEEFEAKGGGEGGEKEGDPARARGLAALREVRRDMKRVRGMLGGLMDSQGSAVVLNADGRVEPVAPDQGQLPMELEPAHARAAAFLKKGQGTSRRWSRIRSFADGRGSNRTSITEGSEPNGPDSRAAVPTRHTLGGTMRSEAETSGQWPSPTGAGSSRPRRSAAGGRPSGRALSIVVPESEPGAPRGVVYGRPQDEFDNPDDPLHRTLFSSHALVSRPVLESPRDHGREEDVGAPGAGPESSFCPDFVAERLKELREKLSGGSDGGTAESSPRKDGGQGLPNPLRVFGRVTSMLLRRGPSSSGR